MEDIDHRFTVEVLTREFQSSDLKISAVNLRKDRTAPTDIFDRIDISKVNNTLKSLLEIKDKEERKIEIIRYSQAESLIKSLMQDDKFRDLSLVERKRVTERILAEIKANVSRPSRREYTGRCSLFECRRIFEKVITYA